MKDNYKKCLDRQNKAAKSGSAASKVIKCKYFDQLSFMYDKTANKPTESNITITTSTSSSLGPTEDQTTEPAPVTKRKSDEAQIKSLKYPKGGPALSMEVDNMLIKTLESMEKEKPSENVDNQNQDPDSLFCRSLIPILQGLPPQKNRLAKLRMQQLLYEIEFDESF